jgi:hypothetical protein
MGTRKAQINRLGDAALISSTDAALLQSSVNARIGTAVGDGDNGLPATVDVYKFTLPSGADGSVTQTLAIGAEIYDAVIVLKGAGTAGSDVQVQHGASTAISDLVDVSAGSDTDVFRVSTIDDAEHVLAAGTVLRVAYSSTGGDFPGAEVYVHALR